jgi:hypothetical protein
MRNISDKKIKPTLIRSTIDPASPNKTPSKRFEYEIRPLKTINAVLMYNPDMPNVSSRIWDSF